VASCPDVAPECATSVIPDHEHHVRLTLTHTDLVARYGLRPGLALSLLLPYDVKSQRVRYTTLAGAPFDPPYGDIHHRTETLRGIADGEVLMLWAPPSTGASQWRVGAGTTFPAGRTVPDPIELGRRGVTHEHLQFGSGVFAPEVEVAWSRPFGRAMASALAQATIPVSGNSHGFRASRNYRWNVGPSFDAGTTRVGFKFAGQYQTVGRWHGDADEGTGFSNGGVRFHLTLPSWRNITIEPSVYRELYSHGLNDETFSQGTTIGLSLTRTF
jgi:hypothetical protein